MSYEEVMKNKPKWHKIYFSWGMWKSGLNGGVIATILFLCIGLFLTSQEVMVYNPLHIGVIGGILVAMLVVLTNESVVNVYYTDWENNYILPYLKTLPKYKVQLEEDIKTVSGSGLIRKVIFEHEGVEKKALAELRFLKEVKEPYITYYIIDQDFQVKGSKRSYIKGEPCFVILHLPMNYPL